MKTSRKVIASIAVVGTVAALAVFALTTSDATSNSSTFLSEDNKDNEVKRLFNEFISKNRRNFLTREEYNARLGNFRKNLEEIDAINKESNNTFTLEINEFGDLTQEEYEKAAGLKDLLEDEDRDFYKKENELPFEEGDF
jgi:hypothetical protein